MKDNRKVLKEDKREKLKKEIKTTLQAAIRSFFLDKEVKVTHPLDLIFPKERRVRSLIGGLETSLGTTLWEPLAKIFAKNNGFEILDEKEFNASVPAIPRQVMHELSDFKEKKLKNYSLLCSDYFNDITNLIQRKNIISSNSTKIPKGEGIDIWLEKDGCEYLIDLKTVQINAGSGPKFLENILKWFTYRALDNINNVDCLLGFPYNPHKKDYWEKEGGKIAPLLKNKEAFVADDFWNILSGMEDTTEFIFEIFKELGEENFGEEFDDIFYLN
tara:strand:+ start:291 stop:1109 length:819 start_codon:yes stop_codon:yes gene_type:complete